MANRNIKTTQVNIRIFKVYQYLDFELRFYLITVLSSSKNDSQQRSAENHQEPRTRDLNTPFTYTPGNGTQPRLRRQLGQSQATNQAIGETATGRSTI